MNKKIIILGFATAMLSICSCSKTQDVMLPNPPGLPNIQYVNYSFVDPQTNSDDQSVVLGKTQDNLKLEILMPKVAEEVTPKVLDYNYQGKDGEVNKLLEQYLTFKGLPNMDVLPKEFYKITATTVKVGENKSDVSLEILDRGNIPYGNYIIPVVISIGDKKVSKFISISKDGDYVAISDENKKPLPPNTDIQRPMKMIAFVETNDWDIRNFGQVILKDSKQPVFDIVVLFAANMNYDQVEGKRYIFFNDKLQPIVEHPEIYIKPLKDRGIKVLIDILPNHQGVGYRNFQSYEEALEFAKDAKKWTDKLGIDGWDMDEEYADYWNLPSKPATNKDQSAYWYIKAMKEVMPDKLLTLYEYGYPHPQDITKYVDYSWANYGESHNRRTGKSLWGLPLDRYAQYSVEANYGIEGSDQAAQYNLRDKTLGLMFFNINPNILKNNGSGIKELSKVTQLFYGQDCEFSGKYYPGPKDKGM